MMSISADVNTVLEAIERLQETINGYQDTVVGYLVEWFFSHYEDPVESQPVEGGDYFWLVSKHDALEVLQDNFSQVPESMIRRAVDEIEEDGTTEWCSLEDLRNMTK